MNKNFLYVVKLLLLSFLLVIVIDRIVYFTLNKVSDKFIRDRQLGN